MTAPALVLLANGAPEPHVAQVAHSLRKGLQAARPELVVRAAFIDHVSPSGSQVLAQLGRMKIDEVVLVPLDITNAVDHRSEIDAVVQRCKTSHPDLAVAVSRPIGPSTELLNLLDQRLRASLSRAKALELDGLVLSAPSAGDVRGAALLARRARQWATHHRLPCINALADGSGPTTAQAIASLRAQGRRHIAVGSFFLAPDDAFLTQAEAAYRAGAVAVSDPFGGDEHIQELVIARYAFAAMDLLDSVDSSKMPLVGLYTVGA